MADIKKGNLVLEPSAGQGAIVRAIVNENPSLVVDVCEIMDITQNILNILPSVRFVCADFLQIPKHYFDHYDRIIANPPFNKNQDIDHISQMFKCLKRGGILVSIASNHWKHSKNKKEVAFREWLDNVSAEIIDIDAGEFKESGTSIATCMIIIHK